MTPAVDRLNAALEGRYRVERELGEGGMAMVYLAEDVKHRRSVALKVLKPELAAVVGADRFLAEIETTANLQHPHILPLYDSGEADSFLFYVMPYVEDESLRVRLDREKQLPVDEALRIAKAVAEALDFAHRHGVIHRDIKPANILLMDGQPVVADFGIALAVGAAGATRLTETGLSVGTPYYMSPEQATGDQSVGPASDIYSLACVLYEMLTGDPPYVGSTAQAVLGQIISGEARPATQLRASVPAHVDAVLRKALEKLPADRFTSAADFARALRDSSFRYGDAPAASGGATVWSRVGPVFAALFLAAAGVAAWALTRSEPEPVSRFKLAFDPTEQLWYTGLNNLPRVDIAPDGSRFVYTGPAGPREQMLWVRPMDQLNGQQLSGTEGGVAPVISPDGERVAYLYSTEGAGNGIRVVSLAGGTPVTLVGPPVYSPPTWGDDGEVYFMASPFTLGRVSGRGGSVDSVMTFSRDDERLAGYTHPYVIPGRAAIVTAVSGDDFGAPEVHVFDLDDGALTASFPGTGGFLTPAGRLAYVTADGILMVQAFDTGSLTPSGNPVPVEWGLDVRYQGITDVDLSGTGTLMYILENTQAPERWVWVNENGHMSPMDPDWTADTEFESMELSPDGTRLALEIQRDDRWDIWIKRVAGGAPSRLTFRGDRNREPAWSPDGSRIAFISYSDEGQDAWVRRADGSGAAELLLDLEDNIFEVLWSPDGDQLLAVVLRPGYDIVAVDPAGTGDPAPLLTGPYDEHQPAISPDGQWLAYTSTETGRHEVFVVPFPNVRDGKWQISTAGGREPRWSADGRQLYIRHGDGSGLDVVDMSGGPIATDRRTVFDVPPQEYLEINPSNHMWDVTPDGRVLMLDAGAGDMSGDMVIVQNWETDAERRLQGDRR